MTHPVTRNFHDFDQAVAGLLPVVFRMAMHHIGRYHEAEDIAAEAICRALRYRKRFDFEKSKTVKPLVMRIAKNMIITRCLRQESRRTLSADQLAYTLEVPVGELFIDTRTRPPAFIFNEVSPRITAAINALGEPQQTIVSMTAEGIRPKEIAVQCKTNSQNVRTHLFKSRERLKEKMGAMHITL